MSKINNIISLTYTVFKEVFKLPIKVLDDIKDKLVKSKDNKDTKVKAITGLTINSVSNSDRCEICHQSDLYDPIANSCQRCQSVHLVGSTNSGSMYVRESGIVKQAKLSPFDSTGVNVSSSKINYKQAQAKEIEINTSKEDINKEKSLVISNQINSYRVATQSAIDAKLSEFNIDLKDKEKLSNINRIYLEGKYNGDPLYAKYPHKRAFIKDICKQVIDFIDYSPEKYLYKLDVLDWFILDSLYKGRTNNSLSNYHLTQDDVMKNFYYSKNVMFPNQGYTYSFRDDHSYAVVAKAVYNLQMCIKAIDATVVQEFQGYKQNWVTQYSRHTLLSLTDYGARLVLLKDALLKLDPYYFSDLLDPNRYEEDFTPAELEIMRENGLID